MYIYNLDTHNPHIGLFGKTGGGKTVYTKEIIKQQVNKGYVDENHIYIFTTSTNNNEWDPYTTCDNFDAQMEGIWVRHTKNKCPALIVFDDYLNTDAYSFNNKHLKRLFTEGRKHSIHGIIQSHEPNGIAPAIRNSLTYKIMFPSGDKNFIRKLADNFLIGDTAYLKQLFDEVGHQPRYTALVLPPDDKPFFDRVDTTTQGNTAEASIKSVNTINNMGNNNVNQIYNAHAIEMNDLVQKNEIAHKIAMQQIRQKEEQDREKMIYETRLLCKKTCLSPQEKYTLIDNLNYLKKSGKPISFHNLVPNCERFMAKRFPDEEYTCNWSPEIEARQATTRLVQEGPQGIVDFAMSYALDSQGTGKHVRNLLGRLLGKSPFEPGTPHYPRNDPGNHRNDPSA